MHFCDVMISNRKVDLMIIGAQKSGTTSLKNYLGQHPEIITHLQTEFTYFLPSSEDGDNIDFIFKFYFPVVVSEKKARLVAKSAAMYVEEESLRRLKSANPDCPVVLLLRNPVDRAYSSYLMEVNSGFYEKHWSAITNTLKRAKRGERDQMFKLFIQMGMYAEHLKNIYNYYSKENVLIFLFEEFKSNPEKVCKVLFNRLGVDDTFIPDTSKRYNPAKRPRIRPVSRFITNLRRNDNPFKRLIKRALPPATFTKMGNWVVNSVSQLHEPASMAPDIRDQLVEFFRPYNEELMNMTGLKIDHWNQ